MDTMMDTIPVMNFRNYGSNDSNMVESELNNKQSKTENIEPLKSCCKIQPSDSENNQGSIGDSSTFLLTKVNVPDAGDYRFSFRKLWAFSGPGFLMSIAYLDPGNIESDLRAGVEASFKLLWILMWATLLGLLIQRLAARLGTVTGYDLAETCAARFHPIPRYILWIMLEITIIGADMQEVIGTAIAFYLLSNRRIPLYGGVLITIVDAFTFLLLDRYGLRRLESFFAFLILVMAGTFGYEYINMAPNQEEVLRGLFIPGCSNCNSGVLLQAVGIVGALITPHNLYLHSALVKSRDINRRNKEDVADANRYYFIEASIALFISLIINIFIVSVFGEGLYQKTNNEVLNICLDAQSPYSHIFPNNSQTLEGDIYKAGLYLGCQFGSAPLYIWAIGLLAAGQSSTMTGTYTGQFVMEGFLELKWSRWKRMLLTRSIAICPTIFVAIFQDVTQMTGMNDFLNALMSLQLPFALLATVLFTSSKMIMGNEFANGVANKVLMSIVSVTLVGLNLYFVYDFVEKQLPHFWAVYLAVSIFLLFYLCVLIYLALCLLVVLGIESLTKIPFLGDYLIEQYDYSREKTTKSGTENITQE